jgi:hypothetical protein
MPALPRRTTIIAAALALAAILARDACAPAAMAGDAGDGGDTYGMRLYIDARHGFSFWYPKDQAIGAASGGHDTESFPGGDMIETVHVGEDGDIVIRVVNSPKHTITDEPNGHAAPIPQTRYYYDEKSRQWMVAYPEGDADGKPSAPAPADVSRKTIGGLPMLGSGARFNTTIIPLSTTRFLVVQSGGGSTYTDELAKTVAPVRADVDPAAKAAALQAEAEAYKKQQ